ERQRHAMRKVFATAIAHGVPIVVPTPVVAEWWRRGVKEKFRATILRSVQVEPLAVQVAKLAGAAVGLVPGAGAVDAVGMAAAATRGDVVYTSDVGDLTALQEAVPEFARVRIVQA